MHTALLDLGEDAVAAVGGHVRPGDDPFAAEVDARKLYIEARQYCDKVGDYVSRALFDETLADEEGHIDFLETQLELINKVGIQNYLQSQMGSGSPT